MAIILPDGFGLATVEMRIAGTAGPAINVWGYDNSAATAQENAEAFRDGYENVIVPVLCVNVILERVKTIQLDGTDYTAGTAYSNEAGDDADASAPPNVTYLVQKTSATPGHSGLGRAYLPGVNETEVDSGGFLSATQQGIVQTALNTFITGFIGQLYILHRDPGPPPTNDYTFATPTLITGLQCESKVATQRRRLR